MGPEDIKRIRLRLGWSQERFAGELGVSFSTVNRWERGRTVPSPMALKSMERLDRSRPEDRRRAVRLKKCVPVRVTYGGEHRAGAGAVALTEDISVTGLKLRGPRKLRTGEKVHLELDLEGDVSASVLSEVIWTEEIGRGSNIGVRFDRITSSDMTKVINAMLRH